MVIEEDMNIFYPPEWSKQKSIWLSFPHNQNEWLQVETENPLKEIQDFYKELIEKILDYQDVNLLLAHEDLITKLWLESLSSKK